MISTRRSLLAAAMGSGALASIAGLSGLLLLTAQAGADDRHDEKRYPKIHASLSTLRDAREELEHAGDDFHGHKETAMRAVDEAIRQLEALVADHP